MTAQITGHKVIHFTFVHLGHLWLKVARCHFVSCRVTLSYSEEN